MLVRLLSLAMLFGSSPVAGQAAPITLSLSWVGEPCNAEGLVEVAIANTSGREIVLPEHGDLGFGGMFLGAASVAGGKTVMSDNLLPPRPPPLRGQARAVRRLGPGQLTTYRVQIDQTSNGMAEGLPHFAFDTAYRQLRRSKGEFWILYALSHSPDATQPYVVAPVGGPLMRSNRLSCPA